MTLHHMSGCMAPGHLASYPPYNPYMMTKSSPNAKRVKAAMTEARRRQSRRSAQAIICRGLEKQAQRARGACQFPCMPSFSTIKHSQGGFPDSQKLLPASAYCPTKGATPFTTNLVSMPNVSTPSTTSACGNHSKLHHQTTESSQTPFTKRWKPISC